MRGLSQRSWRRGLPRYNLLVQNPPRLIETPDDRVVEILRAKTPAERLAIGMAMWSSARRMLVSLVSQQHPEWDADQISDEVARRLSHGAV
jgi:hypothetical protein